MQPTDVRKQPERYRLQRCYKNQIVTAKQYGCGLDSDFQIIAPIGHGIERVVGRRPDNRDDE